LFEERCNYLLHSINAVNTPEQPTGSEISQELLEKVKSSIQDEGAATAASTEPGIALISRPLIGQFHVLCVESFRSNLPTRIKDSSRGDSFRFLEQVPSMDGIVPLLPVDANHPEER
jgi:hypothetical protein